MIHILIILTAFIGTDLAEQRIVLEKQLLTSENPGEVHIKLSDVLTQLGDIKNCVTHAEEALKLLPESPQAHHQYAVALRHKMQQNPVSWITGKSTYLQHLEKAVALDPSFAPAYIEMASFNLSAPRFLGSHTDKAIQLGEELSKYNLKEGARLILKGYDKKEDVKGKINFLETLLKQIPHDAEMNLSMAFALQSEKRYQESLAYLDPFSEGERLDKRNLYQAARSRIMGAFELEKAVALLDRYIDVIEPGEEPNEADARWRQGLAFKALNKPEIAREYYFKALSINVDHEQAKESLRALD